MGKSRLLYKKCYNKSNRERFPQTEKECLLVETNEYRAVLHAWKRGYNALGFEEYKESGRIMIKSNRNKEQEIKSCRSINLSPYPRGVLETMEPHKPFTLRVFYRIILPC